jgi:hypothetical protein
MRKLAVALAAIALAATACTTAKCPPPATITCSFDHVVVKNWPANLPCPPPGYTTTVPTP